MFTVDEIAGEYGRTELTKLVNDVEQVIGVRLPGVLGGEIPMTLGTPLPASMRAIEPSRVMKVPTKVFHARRHGPPGLRNGRCRRVAAPGDAKKRHRAAARTRDVHNRPARRRGVHGCDSFLRSVVAAIWHDLRAHHGQRDMVFDSRFLFSSEKIRGRGREEVHHRLIVEQW